MRKYFSFLLIALLSQSFLMAQTVPSPKSHFGFNIGDNYQLATFTQTEAYLKKLAAVSKKVKLQVIGKTEEGRNHYMVIVSDPSNLANLEKYKTISQKLAHAEDLSMAEATQMANEGKAVVWIDGGLHATEVTGIHQWIESMYQLITRTDEETKRILKSTIILFVHANPDGQELVSNWYMRNSDTLKRTTSSLPRLYQKYIGHDNNRDFYMTNMQESKNMSRQQYIEWMPQVLYNHHQTGPPGTVVAGPPYRDPFNYVYDPLLITGIDALGAAMSSRLNAESKPGYTMKSGSVYSTWWNGGLRTTAYYHNIIGLLTEIIGNPTPSNIPLVPQRLIPNSATPYPITPQKWYFRNSIDYSVSLNYAVLNYAARYREELLLNIYKMGRHSIEAGNKDSWTLYPKRADAVAELLKTEKLTGNIDSFQTTLFNKVYKNVANRDARGYIVTANQTTTAIDFINILIQSGIKVEKANANFSVAGKNYPAGSYIVKTNQAFRPHVIDMFEPQDHPNDFQYPGGPPVRPYDAAGWTPAFTMGIEFDRVLDDFNGPFETIPYGIIQKPIGKINTIATVAGYSFSTKENAAYYAINTLLAMGVEVYKNKDQYFVAVNTNNKKLQETIESLSAEKGIIFNGVTARPTNMNDKIMPQRIALWDKYGGSMSSGWVRWIFEKYNFPFQLIYAKEIDASNLKDKYDVILFVEGAIPSLKPEAGNGYEEKEPKTEEVPEIYQASLGKITAEKSIPALNTFLQNGGTIITIGSSANLAYHLNVPVRNTLVEMVAGKEKSLPGEKFYIPGSVMQITLDNEYKANWGMNKNADVYFSASPVFKLLPDAIARKEVIPLAWYASDKTLRSGWAFGQSYLQDGIAAFEAKVGNGKLFVYGPEITFRGQTHSNYKMLFNQLYK
ncbi:MAG: peptidase [Sediminibacterium sp.]|nr:MAG: peptidase [Sediminibacterium sp.]